MGRIQEACMFSHHLYACIVEIALLCYFLTRELSWYAVIPGIGINVLFFFVQARMGRALSTTRKASIKAADARVKVVIETINSIRLTKLYACNHLFFLSFFLFFPPSFLNCPTFIKFYSHI